MTMTAPELQAVTRRFHVGDEPAVVNHFIATPAREG
jgi:hypothetical protein